MVTNIVKLSIHMIMHFLKIYNVIKLNGLYLAASANDFKH